MTERFYSGRRDGQMTVRDGIAAANKRPLPPRAVLFKHGEKGLTQIGDLRNAVSKLPAIATSTPYLTGNRPAPRSKARAGSGPPLGSASRARIAHKNGQRAMTTESVTCRPL